MNLKLPCMIKKTSSCIPCLALSNISSGKPLQKPVLSHILWMFAPNWTQRHSEHSASPHLFLHLKHKTTVGTQFLYGDGLGATMQEQIQFSHDAPMKSRYRLNCFHYDGSRLSAEQVPSSNNVLLAGN